MTTFKHTFLSALPQPKVRASLARSFLTMAEHKGLDRAALLHIAGWHETDIAELDQEVPALQLVTLIKHLETNLPDVSLGIALAEHLPTNAFGTLGYAMRHSATLREGLSLLLRYVTIVSSHARVDQTDVPEGIRLTVKHHPLIARVRHPIEVGAVITTKLCGFGNATDILHSVQFKHQPTGPIEDYRAFFGITPTFGASETSYVVSKAALDRPLPYADDAYTDYLTKLLQQTKAFSDQESDPLDVALHKAIAKNDYRVEAWAEAAGLSPRSLHRRLASQKRNPRQVLDEARRDNALSLLSDPDLPVSDVAFLLSYSEERAFIRAFKRWVGVTPIAYRRQRVPR